MKYKIIYADPPWDYDMKVGQGVAIDQYPTLKIEELRRLPVEDIADQDCVLFLWVTFPKLIEALSLFKYWGFRYKTCAFNWVKRNKKSDSYYFGLGFWTRTCSEVCLLGTKGHPQRVSNKVRQVCDARIMEHSRKPDEIRDRIVELCGMYRGSNCLQDGVMRAGMLWGMRLTVWISEMPCGLL